MATYVIDNIESLARSLDIERFVSEWLTSGDDTVDARTILCSLIAAAS